MERLRQAEKTANQAGKNKKHEQLKKQLGALDEETSESNEEERALREVLHRLQAKQGKKCGELEHHKGKEKERTQEKKRAKQEHKRKREGDEEESWRACWYREWLRAWGLQAHNLWAIRLRCSIVHKDGHTICSALIQPREPTEHLRYTRTIWQEVRKILSLGTSRTAATKGLFVNAQSPDANKWQGIRTVGYGGRLK